ncbi:16S rRNA methyltransferase [Pasteurellaceae bacterium Macca]|nr:16S rRNA methyltransferase [Pasteurellaceae bacterium Macca]
MLSLESDVLKRHLPRFKDRSILLFGHLRDDFAKTLQPLAKNVALASYYYDFARKNGDVDSTLTHQTPAELAVFYWVKNKQECQFQLLQWLSHQAVGQEVLIIGENRSGVRSVEKLLQPYGEIGKIDSARRCGLYHFCLQQVPSFNAQTYWKSYPFQDLTVFSLPGVFSATELDNGTQLLLSTFHKADGLKGKVLDLGCGAGVIGASLKQRFPKIKLTMSDIHTMALASSERTLAENQLEGQVLASDVFSDVAERFDLIISNPPFHDGIDTAYTAVETLIQQAKMHLNRGGELRIVANAFLPYPDLLDKAFGTHDVLAKSTKFKVYRVRA